MKSFVTFFISAYTATLGKNLASHTFCLCQEFVENLIRSGFVGVGLNCTTVMMLTKAIWLLDDGYCMGSTFYLFVACLWCRWYSSLSAFVGFQQLPENQRNFFTVSNCLQVCRQHCVCVHRLYILSRLFSFVLPASHLTITIFIYHQFSITLQTHIIHTYSNSLTSTHTLPKPSGPQRKGVWNIHTSCLWKYSSTHKCLVKTHTRQHTSCVILHCEHDLWEAPTLLDLKQWEGYKWVPWEQRKGEEGEEVKTGIRRIHQSFSFPEQNGKKSKNMQAYNGTCGHFTLLHKRSSFSSAWNWSKLKGWWKNHFQFVYSLQWSQTEMKPRQRGANIFFVYGKCGLNFGKHWH